MASKENATLDTALDKIVELTSTAFVGKSLDSQASDEEGSNFLLSITQKKVENFLRKNLQSKIFPRTILKYRNG